jgi:hypothetical protein
LVKRIKHSTIPLPPPSYSCFLRGVGVLHDVREMRRESKISLQSSKEWEDVVVVSTPIDSCAEIFFIFLIFRGIFSPNFVHAI